MTIEVIQDKQAFEQVVNEKEAFILLKHSLTCPVSTFAHHQYKQFTDGANVPAIFFMFRKQEIYRAILPVNTAYSTNPRRLFISKMGRLSGMTVMVPSRRIN